jgi:hypothetical protein
MRLKKELSRVENTDEKKVKLQLQKGLISAIKSFMDAALGATNGKVPLTLKSII